MSGGAVRCIHVWLDPCEPTEPDTNHCAPLPETAEDMRRLTNDQYRRLMSLVDARVLCPFFSPKEGIDRLPADR